MRQYKYHILYKTTCKVTKRFYIGIHSTNNLQDGYVGSGKRLWRSLKKHGFENHHFEILEFLPDRASLKAKEEEIVNEEFLKNPQCLNMILGGKDWAIEAGRIGGKIGGHAGGLKTGPVNVKFAYTKVAQLRKEGTFKNRGTLGYKHTYDSRKKMSDSKTGQMNPQYGKCWIHSDSESKIISKEELNFWIEQGWNKGRRMFIQQ